MKPQSHLPSYPLQKDIGIIITSIVVAYLLVEIGAFDELIRAPKQIKLLSSFIAGFFFTSLFTTAIATVTLAEIALTNNIIMIALVGGLGAALGDLIIFRFIKDHIAEDVRELLGHAKRLKAVFRLRFFRFMIPFLGALVIASPLPDELGLAMLGIIHFKLKYLLPISYVFNAIGILIIGLVARGLFG